MKKHIVVLFAFCLISANTLEASENSQSSLGGSYKAVCDDPSAYFSGFLVRTASIGAASSIFHAALHSYPAATYPIMVPFCLLSSMAYAEQAWSALISGHKPMLADWSPLHYFANFIHQNVESSFNQYAEPRQESSLSAYEQGKSDGSLVVTISNTIGLFYQMTRMLPPSDPKWEEGQISQLMIIEPGPYSRWLRDFYALRDNPAEKSYNNIVFVPYGTGWEERAKKARDITALYFRFLGIKNIEVSYSKLNAGFTPQKDTIYVCVTSSGEDREGPRTALLLECSTRVYYDRPGHRSLSDHQGMVFLSDSDNHATLEEIRNLALIR